MARRIKDLKIQGAQNIAISAIRALMGALGKARNTSQIDIARHQLSNARPTEPLLRNALKYIFYNTREDDFELYVEHLKLKSKSAIEHLEQSRSHIARIGWKKIHPGYVVFTHCHSTSVLSILRQAKDRGVLFEVHNTETRPNYQGRTTARELAESGIHVSHYIDAAARLALKKADIAFFGCDSITTSSIHNKIGTAMFCEIAEKLEVPVYFCADSWKIFPDSFQGQDELIEKRPDSEVWPGAPKRVSVENRAFEEVDPGVAAGIISELGVLPHALLLKESREAYPWLFT